MTRKNGHTHVAVRRTKVTDKLELLPDEETALRSIAGGKAYEPTAKRLVAVPLPVAVAREIQNASTMIDSYASLRNGLLRGFLATRDLPINPDEFAQIFQTLEVQVEADD